MCSTVLGVLLRKKGENFMFCEEETVKQLLTNIARTTKVQLIG